ncbi:MAG: DEAD/DEAH box helicase [Bacteroidetes bacterium]|nr:MAG: DEAD/DEAH box helicase [Bacteroidota bacterium]
MEIKAKKKKAGKELYPYQKEDLEKIFERFDNCPPNYNLLYQLPTGGGKTVVFSEITRQYLQRTDRKVLVLTHRIELCKQTSRMLTEFGVTNKIIDSKVKTLPDKNEYKAFVAMVETLNNRLNDEQFHLNEVGLVIVDEAHYNSFRKLFKFFDNCFMLGVTATPLSSNIKLPMNEIYDELIVGTPISKLIEDGFLAKATTYSYNVRLGGLQIGINGDYTVKSSEELYSNAAMQTKLLYAYKKQALGKKTLIFNAGINTSLQVCETFTHAGFEIRHLDSHCSKQERREILKWFHNKPDAILTSVGILTTGFDEPGIEVIILNRATRSLSLYYQMIGRGSRIAKGKQSFSVIDLGNNAARFGLWEKEVDWDKIFRYPERFLASLISDEEIERNFKYTMPEEIREQFANSEVVDFDIYEEHKKVESEGLRTKVVLDRSIDQHAQIVLENSDQDFAKALALIRLLDADIEDRVRRFSYCISKSTRNYRDWLKAEYKRKLRMKVTQKF